MDIAPLLKHMVEAGASDLHLKVGLPPVIRVDGTLHHTEFPRVAPEDTETAALALLPESKTREFAETNEADVGFALDPASRFRVNVFRQRGLVGLAIRRVRSVIPSFEELMLPPGAVTLAEEHRGLVLVTGPAGTGKTTTIAAMIGWINARRTAHVITIEDPIEVVHEDRRSIIDQREVGLDTASYGTALRFAVRQDPDVVFIGEIRDMETAEAAIQAAETGHLVISTLHTLDATETINRLIDLFPATMQRQVRVSLAASLRGVLSQRLVTRADGSGRVPTVEVLVNTGRVAERILDPELTSTIPDVIAEGSFYGMQTFDQSLAELVKTGLVTVEDAADHASSRHDFMLALKQAQLA